MKRAIFIHGFATNVVENISSSESEALRKLAFELLTYRQSEIEQAVDAGTMIEVRCDDREATIS
jgi:hypothetical protein